MGSTYEMLAQFAQSGGMVYCLVLFLGVLVYALWPANSKTFNDAAHMPLRED
jgi:cytochrome c oxidase cbb3-type subunit 4